ncbi:Xaa-Pro aminopeptidase [Neolewinella maritima]|uniref:Xaa-Pro aminopeptidase n=1 Tax=Neolewinella maritima TaxID=1383882 RepID=A0ABN8F7P4_9BACT|nr:aminopeptidase P family protein [Neolewinella maritima]CAH1001299.1 Xaa-Pro aminopeptidase [Neolewinella maritima]
MFTTQTYVARRKQLAEAVGHGLIILPGNGEAPMNYAGNPYPFRQDSTFRYFAGLNQPDLILTINAETGESLLYGDEATLDDMVWMGEQTGLDELAQRAGLQVGGNLQKAVDTLCLSEVVHYLPTYRDARQMLLCQCLNEDDRPSEKLIRAVIAQRSYKSAEELAEMDRAVTTSMAMHRAAAAGAKPGMREAEVAGMVEGLAISAGGRLAYAAIVSRDGHILHNHAHHNVLREGDLLLIDAGAETPSGYAGDITRTFAVGAEMTAKQQAVYDIVDDAKRRVIEAIRPGVPFRELHDLSARIITNGLKQLGLMKGDTAEAVAAGAHALFYPHGLGHMIGLDVHDMEDLGEDFVGYDEEFQRSEQFGTRNLRLGRRLEEGFTITVEPGIYFIPILTDRWRAEGKHTEYINYDALAAYRDFGGIRLEDNVVVTADNCRVLGSV